MACAPTEFNDFLAQPGVVGGTVKPRSTRSSGSQSEARGARGPRLGHHVRRGLASDRRRATPAASQPRWRKKKFLQHDDSLFDWKVYDQRFWSQYWLKFSGVANLHKMPLSGSTRMLRARRKDINVKPNRRLDRKSSKGMLFENEELRMRTIAINSEVEQGQQALKKLRRENELLRREVWSLRDEYAKMELQKKETDDEESDQENSYTEDESEDEEEGGEGEEEEGEPAEEEGDMPTGEDPNQENVENLQKSSRLAPRRSSRTFDGLSVIDEQTEETQTTDGYGNSRSSSTIRADTKITEAQKRPLFSDPCSELSYYPVYSFLDPHTYKGQRKRNEGLEAEWGMMGFRPPSPYPYAKGSPMPHYQHRLQNLQEPCIPPLPGRRAEDSSWLYPPQSASAASSPGRGAGTSTWYPQNFTRSTGQLCDSEGGWMYPSDTSTVASPCEAPLSIRIPRYGADYLTDPPEGFGSDNALGLEQERQGPDVFITDSYPYLPPPPVDLIGVASDLNKIEISQKSENSPKYTMGSHVLSAPTAEEESAIATSSTQTQPAMQTESADGGAEPGLVACQFPSTEDSRQIAVPTASEDADMRRVEKTSAKPFQSKLTLTLRFPENGRKSPGRQSTPQPPAGVGKPVRYPVPLKHELPRLQTFAGTSRTHPTPHTGNAPGPLNGLPERHPVVAADIPVPDSAPTSFPRALGSSTSLDGLTSTGKANTGGPSGLSKLKIPPAPPPRTTSCPAVSNATIPTPPVGVTALHHRAFRKGKSTSITSQHESDREIVSADTPPSNHSSTNPLMLSEPVATSSPTLQPKFTSHKSIDSQKTVKLRKQNSVRSMTQDETTDEGMVSGSSGLIRKSSKSSKAEAERLSSRKLRKQSQVSVNSLENNPLLCDRTSSRLLGLNNVSISSSSGLDSPTKSDRRKRRVSIKFNKKNAAGGLEEERPGILTNVRLKSRCDETDGTTSDRERTNSVSSRTSSVTRRKLSTSSSRTVFHEEKIPWCGCWGNGCL